MIAQGEIEAIADFVSANGLSEAIISDLRDQYPGKHFTWCMEDDINVGRPVVERQSFSIYLVDSREHCSKLTNDPDIASGVVLAEVYDEE